MPIRETVRRAFASFLAIPTATIAVFALLAIGVDALDRTTIGWLSPIRSFLQGHVFADAQSTSNLLGTVAGGTITITSITFSLLLLALQQSAASLTHEVLDQFMRRRLTQLYFGFFVGLTLYDLIILATVDPPFNPVFGATLAIVLTAGSLYVLLLLIYSSITQMRPNEIIRAIHDFTLQARRRQLGLIARTRRVSKLPPSAPAVEVAAQTNGYVVGFDLDGIAAAISATDGGAEVKLLTPVGAYVAYGDPLAEARAERSGDASAVALRLNGLIQIERGRRLDDDPAYGIEQLETIAWRSISTSQQNPAPGLVVIRNLRDLLARWSEPADLPDIERAPIVYVDNVMARLLDAFELLAVVASEAMQPQTIAAIARTLAITFDRLPGEEQARVVELALTTLSALGEHVLTAELDGALILLAETLARNGYAAAEAIRAARDELATSIGRLNSRSTRVPSAP
jgi:uncharacterized membrane protein